MYETQSVPQDFERRLLLLLQHDIEVIQEKKKENEFLCDI